jgi:hypothetical protein
MRRRDLLGGMAAAPFLGRAANSDCGCALEEAQPPQPPRPTGSFEGLGS